MSALAQSESRRGGVPASVPLLREQELRRGERWVFSAGFNTADPERNPQRVDAELADLERLAASGARVAILSHQGRFADGTARSLQRVASRLRERLGRPVAYWPDPTSEQARRAARELGEGELALFGNTRLHAGEEANDRWLARRFAALGDRVAIGGFSKAHRRHASNVGILEFLPGCLADSVVRELELLGPWRGPAGRLSIAVVGGLKREKLAALAGLADDYDVLVPGGAALNLLLRAAGAEIGDSDLGEVGAELAAAEALLAAAGPRLHLPGQFVVAPAGRAGAGAGRLVEVAAGVPRGEAIVDFVLEPWLCEQLGDAVAGGGRMLIAGTPALCDRGHLRAVAPLLRAAAAPRVDAILLGGDTVAELPWCGPSSTGGGSALRFVAGGEWPVLDALAAGGTGGR